MSSRDGTPRLVVGGDSARRDEDLSREFLLAFSQLLQVSRFHELDNVALTEPIEAVIRLTGQACGDGRRLHVLVDEEQIFVNRRRLRSARATFGALHELTVQLAARELAGFEILQPFDRENLTAFLFAFHGVARDESGVAERLEAALREAGVEVIAMIRPPEEIRRGPAPVELDEERLAALLYAKAVVVLRGSLRCWEDEHTRHFLGARARRIIQDIISLAERAPRPFLWLVHVKDEEDYICTHSANVALLSILIGLRIGLNRNHVCELGTAALFHDMGRSALPTELRDKKGEFTEDERQLMARHPIHGVNMLLQLGTLNRALLSRLIVVFEHNIVANGYPRQAWSGDLHIFSRIVAIADAYDAMTTRKSFRPARTPDEAMRELASDAGVRYDADLVQVFTAVMGVYPLGTLVRLDTGEAGLVFHVDPSSPRRPLVKLVWNASGERVEDGDIVDLGESDGGGGFARSIVGTDDPHRLGIHVPAYLMESEE